MCLHLAYMQIYIYLHTYVTYLHGLFTMPKRSPVQCNVERRLYVFFRTFQKWLSDKHAHFTQWLARCAEVRKQFCLCSTSLSSFLFHSLHDYLPHFSCVFFFFPFVKPSATPWMPLRRDRPKESARCVRLTVSLSVFGWHFLPSLFEHIEPFTLQNMSAFFLNQSATRTTNFLQREN